MGQASGVALSVEQLAPRLRRFAPKAPQHTLLAFLSAAARVLPDAGISDTAQRFCHLLAQIGTETALFTADAENLHYSAKGLLRVFGVGTHSSAQVTAAEAVAIAGKPELIAERVYGIGNPKKPNFLGNTQPGDGWKYRGRGLLMLTGRDQYTRYGKLAGIDLAGNPDLASDPLVAMRVAAALWRRHHCNHHADCDHIVPITKAINGGVNGLPDRRRNYHHARLIWA
jgi:putative chitinase